MSYIAATIYPSGIGNSSLVGAACRIFRGWPVSASLIADLEQDVVNVSVFPMSGGRTTTRWADEYANVQSPAALQVIVAGNSATFTGSADPGQLAGLLLSGRRYTYRTQPGDTTSTVVAALAELIGSDQLVTVQGATLTLPDLDKIVARTGADASVSQELRRQEQRVRVSVWAASPAQRDVAASAIDLSLAAVDFLPLADGSTARLRFNSGVTLDDQETAGLYRRDLVYTAEYGTILIVELPEMLFGGLSMGQSFIIS